MTIGIPPVDVDSVPLVTGSLESAMGVLPVLVDGARAGELHPIRVVMPSSAMRY